MISKKIGLQLYTVRDELQKDFTGTIEKISEMGYDGVESGFYADTEAAENFMNILKKYNLTLAACHISIEDLKSNLDKIVSFGHKYGCTNAVISYSDNEHRPGGNKFEEALSLYQTAGKKLKENGIDLFYHNHDFEFADYKGACGFDYMFEKVPSEYFNPEIDLCWLKVAGKDPVEYLKKYKNRCRLLHIKDFVKTEKGVEFRPLGKGVQDMKRLIGECEKTVAEWYIVEQDFCYDIPSVEAARISLEELAVRLSGRGER